MKNLIHRPTNLILLLLVTTLVNNSYAQSLSTVASGLVPTPRHLLGGEQLWGVELTAPDVLCLDGTTPAFYVDEAVNGSNNWVFFLQGGGSCSTGQGCADKYITSIERNEMSTHWAMRSISGGGILNPDPTINEFANYNRVKIKKCSYDRWMGNKTLTVSATSPGGVEKQYDVNFHGREIIKAVFNQLATGIPYHDESCDVGENCRTLPPLSDAGIVLLTGSSGGGIGLSHAADDLASEISTIRADCATPPCTATDIRAVVDAAFMPGLDSEYRFPGNISGGGIMDFTHATTGQAGTATFDLQIYSAPSGAIYVQQEKWRDDRDSSCEAQHGPNHPLCEDHLHIIRYHLETPLFIRQDLGDPNIMHTNHGNGWTPFWAIGADLPVAIADYANRVITQADMYTNLEISGMPIEIFSPTCQQHVGLTNNDGFYLHSLENQSTGIFTTFHDALFNWVTNIPGTALIRMDEGVNYTSSC